MTNPVMPTRGERVLRSLAYLLMVCAGVYGVFGELPHSLESITTPFHLVLWSLFMCSVIVAAFGTLFGKMLLEYSVLIFGAGACVIYVAAMASVVVTGENPGSGVGLCLVAALACCLGSRFTYLRNLLKINEEIRRERKELKDEF